METNNSIKLYLSDWLWNASLLGFLRIQESRGIQYDISKGSIEIRSDDLDGFEDAYFILVLKRYISNSIKLSITLDSLKFFEENSQKEIINKYKEKRKDIIDFVQEYNGSFSSLIKEIEGRIGNLIKTLSNHFENESLKHEQTQQLANKIKKVGEKINKEIYDKKKGFLKDFIDPSANYLCNYLKRFYFNKGVVGNYSIKGDRITRFKENYVEPAQNDINCKKQESTLKCKFVKTISVEPKSFNNSNDIFGESMFSITGISTQSFKNFFFNFQADIFPSKLAELILLCSWAGFTEIPFKFRDSKNTSDKVFVNLPKLDYLIEENKKIENLYKLSEIDKTNTIYESIIQDIFLKIKEFKSQWALQNILFIELETVSRKDTNKPHFYYFQIGKDLAKLFNNDTAIKAANNLRGKIFIRRSINVTEDIFLYTRRETVRRILNYEDLNTLSYYALRDQIRGKPSFYNLQNAFSISVLSLIRSNIQKQNKSLKIKNMDSKTVFGILKSYQNAGESLCHSMDFEKRKRLSYRLLSLIRNGKTEDFYESIMKIFIGQSKAVPDVLVSLLNKEDMIEAESKAYAFMTGFMQDKEEKKQENSNQ